jgi:hypothetical protein
MNAATSHLSLRQLCDHSRRHALQLKHGATDEANARRIMQLLKHRALRASYFTVRHAADMLASMIRAEAQSAQAGADDPKGGGGAEAYFAAVERATVLRAWASHSEFESIKAAARALVWKKLTEQTLEQTT